MLCFFPIQGIAGWKGTPATFVMRVQLDLVKYFDKELEKKAQRKGITTLYLNTNLVSNMVVHCVFEAVMGCALSAEVFQHCV